MFKGKYIEMELKDYPVVKKEREVFNRYVKPTPEIINKNLELLLKGKPLQNSLKYLGQEFKKKASRLIKVKIPIKIPKIVKDGKV